MCTVSYVSTTLGYILTSNRDEKLSRKLAKQPIQDGGILYPKDLEKNGTWIAVKNNGDAICLLNGAFEKHTITTIYKKSRGLIVLEIIKEKNMFDFISMIDLTNIEPFTLVIIENKKLVECRWDGAKKHFKFLSTKKNYLWRSCTLYNKDIIKLSENLFTIWISNKLEITQKEIVDFHKNTKVIDKENSFLVHRNNELSTVSITSIQKNNQELLMQYEDLIGKNTTIKYFEKVEM